MKTEQEIKAQIKQLRKVNENEHYEKNTSSALMNQGSINALEWVLE